MTVYKSTAITNLDASPILRAGAGTGAPGRIQSLSSGGVTIPSVSTSSDRYLMLRLPSNAIVKHLWFSMDASVTTLGIDIGTYYSDSTTDGTSATLVNTTILSGTSSIIAVNFDAHTNAAPLDLWSSAATGGALVSADRTKPLWQTKACALTSDPGGFIDIVIVPHANTNGAAVVSLDVEFVVNG